MSGQTWSGAKILANMGFEPKGINLSLVMVDKVERTNDTSPRPDWRLHIDKSNQSPQR
jgi:hypothetical protein